MGALYEDLGDDFRSLECIETAFRLAPEDDSTALYNKALALMRIGCYGDAVSVLDGLFERYPENPKYLPDRGFCALDMGCPQEALQYYQQAMEIWQRDPSTYTGICIYPVRKPRCLPRAKLCFYRT
jgi:tetratricopeptide (TPR) repeat protein